MPVHYEVDGPIAIVTIDRPEVANAIDRPTADALADAFRRFDADASLAVAVLTGADGKFCAGADLKAMRRGPGARHARRARRRRPGRADADAARQAGHRRRRGARGRRRSRARRLVRSARRGRGRRVRRLLPALGHPADGRRHHSPDAAHRPQPCARPDPHRPRRLRARRRCAWASRTASCRPVGRCAEAIALAREIASRPQAALRSDRLSLVRAMVHGARRGARRRVPARRWRRSRPASCRAASSATRRATGGRASSRERPTKEMTAMAPLSDDQSVVQRILDHIDHGTTDLSDETWREPVRALPLRGRASPPRSRWSCAGTRRRSARPRRCPSPAPTSRATPRARRSLAVRGSDGRARAFRNACRHRGTQLAEGIGLRARRSCAAITAGPTVSTASCATCRTSTASPASTRARAGSCRWRRPSGTASCSSRRRSLRTARRGAGRACRR